MHVLQDMISRVPVQLLETLVRRCVSYGFHRHLVNTLTPQSALLRLRDAAIVIFILPSFSPSSPHRDKAHTNLSRPSLLLA